jgi:hypothetical protein
VKLTTLLMRKEANYVMLQSKIIVGWVMSYISLGFALDLFLSPALFESAPDYWRVFNYLSSEFILGCVATLVAAIKICGLLLENTKVARTGLFLSCIFWCFMAVIQSFGKGYFDYSMALANFTGLAILSLWASKKEVVQDDTEPLE